LKPVDRGQSFGRDIAIDCTVIALATQRVFPMNNKNPTVRPSWAIVLALFVGLFGAVTLKSGGEVLFIDGVGRKAAGNYVPFVVWFNFLAGFVYIAGAAGLVMWRAWIIGLAFAIAMMTIVVFIGLGFHIMLGGAFEERTIAAMGLRSLVWMGIALVVRTKMRS